MWGCTGEVWWAPVPRKQRSFFAGAPWYQQPAPRCRGGRRTGSAGPPEAGVPTARPWGSAFRGQSGALQLAADPPQMERTSLSETPSAWAPWHPVAQTLCFRCRGRRFNPAGEDPTGHVARPEKVKKKKKKGKEKKCLLSSQPFTEHASACSQPQEHGGGCGSPPDVVLPTGSPSG